MGGGFDGLAERLGVDLPALGLAWARALPTVTLVPAFGLKARALLPSAARDGPGARRGASSTAPRPRRTPRRRRRGSSRSWVRWCSGLPVGRGSGRAALGGDRHGRSRRRAAWCLGHHRRTRRSRDAPHRSACSCRCSRARRSCRPGVPPPSPPSWPRARRRTPASRGLADVIVNGIALALAVGLPSTSGLDHRRASRWRSSSQSYLPDTRSRPWWLRCAPSGSSRSSRSSSGGRRRRWGGRFREGRSRSHPRRSLGPSGVDRRGPERRGARCRPGEARQLDHRAGFVLTFVDGVSSVDTRIDASGLPRLEMLRILQRAS